MLIEIYTENEVSPIDKRNCLENNTNHRMVKYTTIGSLYVIYKDVKASIVMEMCNLILKK